MNSAESKYIERKEYLSRCTRPAAVARAEALWLKAGKEDQQKSLSNLQEDLPRFVPFLARHCGVDFRGRILEIGAGGAWLSAELSKLPRVVEIVTTDISPRLLKEEAPRIFKRLRALTAKITRTPADFHQLHFPDEHFDFVVCSAVLQDAGNIVQVLREAKRVLKPGGQFVAVREPVWPWMKLGSGSAAADKSATDRGLTLTHYKELFKQAALPVQVKRVNTASGFRYLLNSMVNGLTHARYAFVATKRGSGAAPPRRPVALSRAPRRFPTRPR